MKFLRDEQLLRRAERDLGLTALRPLPPTRSGHHVVIMYRRETLGAPQDYNTDFADQFEHGVGVGVWAVPGLPRPPLFGPPPELSRMYMRDRVTQYRDRECTEPNTDVAEYFDRAGFDDAGEILYHLAEEDKRHLARTGKSDRIDRFLLTKSLRSTVTGGGPLDTPAEAADHSGIAMTIDTALIDTSLTV